MLFTVVWSALTITSIAPFQHPPVQESDITYYLFTREIKNRQIHKNEIRITGGGVVLLIHGWSESRATPWYSNLTNALLAQNHKVLQVDWSRPASLNYIQATTSVKQVGTYIAQFIYSLRTPFRRVHLIGHSLGAHVASFAGKYIHQSGLRLGRITALDPAGPGFLLRPSSERLNREDAKWVVVLHTDCLLGYGLKCGHVDFYANGGCRQIGCPSDLQLGSSDAKCDSNGTLCFCSHHRSFLFYIEALEIGSVIGRRRSDGRQLSLGSEMKGAAIEGNYAFTTNAQAPYGLY